MQGCLMSTNDAPRRASVYRRALWRQHGRLQFFISYHTTKHTLTSADFIRERSLPPGVSVEILKCIVHILIVQNANRSLCIVYF